jgi:hypothetical protein
LLQVADERRATNFRYVIRLQQADRWGAAW